MSFYTLVASEHQAALGRPCFLILSCSAYLACVQSCMRVCVCVCVWLREGGL